MWAKSAATTAARNQCDEENEVSLYEKLLKIDPDNESLKASLQLAKDKKSAPKVPTNLAQAQSRSDKAYKQ